jgi:DNA mismatch endonuclease (patch repair protein)
MIDYISRTTKDSIQKSMRSNTAADTRPELNLRRALWAAGMRGYRKNYKSLPGRPDIVFTRARVCIFVQGCFWHQCPKCCRTRNLKPTRNSEYWHKKLVRNKERDEQNIVSLQHLGWTVFLAWECDIKKDPGSCLDEINAVLTRRLEVAENAMTSSAVVKVP